MQEAIHLASELKSKLRPLHVIDDFPMLAELSTLSSFGAGIQQMRQYGESVLAKALAQATMAHVEAETVLREVTQGSDADRVVRGSAVPVLLVCQQAAD